MLIIFNIIGYIPEENECHIFLEYKIILEELQFYIKINN